MTRQGRTDEPEAVAGLEAAADTEGNSMVNPFLARELARGREQEVQRNLKDHQRLIAARAAKDDVKRPYKR